MTRDEALEHAARILHNAEGETNLALLERLNALADSWINLADVLTREPA